MLNDIQEAKLVKYGKEKKMKLSGLTWEEIADLMNKEFYLDLSESFYRKHFKLIEDEFEDENDLVAMSKRGGFVDKDIHERRDELIQANALYRRMSREQSLKDIAHDFAVQMNAKKILDFDENNRNDMNPLVAGVLMLSDWHYGIEFNNYWNKYNPEICKERVSKLLVKTIDYIKMYKLSKLTVINLADMIAGRIHLQLRLNSRIDVVTQTMEVSEILAEFLNKLSEYVTIDYYDVLDNHSRIEPNKKEAMQLESLARITKWYLKERLPQITVHDNEMSESFAQIDLLGHRIIAVHGDKDKPNTVAKDIGAYTDSHVDLVCTAHRHHFGCDETCKTVVVCNGTLMGTDDYAEDLRLSSTPSQNLIIMTRENPIEAIHRIIL